MSELLDIIKEAKREPTKAQKEAAHYDSLSNRRVNSSTTYAQRCGAITTKPVYGGKNNPRR